MIPKTPPEVLEIQNEIYRKMTLQEKWRISLDLWNFGLDLVERGIRQTHSDWNPEEVHREFRRRVLSPELFRLIEEYRAAHLNSVAT